MTLVPTQMVPTTHNTIAAAAVNLPDITLGGTTVCPVLSGAMAQLASNQAAMMTHMAALQIAPTHPPTQQIMIPQQQSTGADVVVEEATVDM